VSTITPRILAQDDKEKIAHLNAEKLFSL